MSSPTNLGAGTWSLTGWRPHAWKLRKSAETGGFLLPDVGPVAARLPGSVQENLRRAGVIPDWRVGLNSLAIEWVEHRHWMFSTTLPPVEAGPGERVFFQAESLDYHGWVLVDGKIAGQFRGPQLPTRLDLTSVLAGPGTHTLALVFDLPPEEHGQLGYTSQSTTFKPRYSYSWDWCPRVVPSGARGELSLVRETGHEVKLVGVRTSVSDDFCVGEVVVRLAAEGGSAGDVELTLWRDGVVCAVAEARVVAGSSSIGLRVDGPDLWWPNGEGQPSLYELRVAISRGGRPVRTWTREIGFKHIAWRACEGASADALPWICVVNGRPIFLQGVNWTPVRLCYQDTTPAEIARLVAIYRDLGCNLLRVWGGAYLESPEFYEECDRAGLLVWQEFPLSSSGMDSEPPTSDEAIATVAAIARHFIRSRQHHACLLQWCGGNELQNGLEGARGLERVPCDLGSPCLAALAAVVAEEDPGRRFLPTSPYGPRFHSQPAEFGRGVHHEVHGPWGLEGFADRAAWEDYWTRDDSLFRGEAGVSGASDVALIRRFAGGAAVWPPSTALWHHGSSWWTQWERLRGQFAGLTDEEGLARYVEFTQREQAETLAFAVRATKAKFPRCGGFLVWMGHDCFPCLANTSIVDCEHGLKPVALALREVWRAPVAELQAQTCPPGKVRRSLTHENQARQ